MIKVKTIRSLFLMAGVALMMLSTPVFAEGPLNILSAKGKTYSPFKTANGIYDVVSLLGSGDVAGWQFGGIVRFTKKLGPIKDWTYWYTETNYVLSGSGRITASTIPFLASHSYDVGPGDIIFIPTGTRITYEALTDEPFVLFYAAPE